MYGNERRIVTRSGCVNDVHERMCASDQCSCATRRAGTAFRMGARMVPRGIRDLRRFVRRVRGGIGLPGVSFDGYGARMFMLQTVGMPMRHRKGRPGHLGGGRNEVLMRAAADHANRGPRLERQCD